MCDCLEGMREGGERIVSGDARGLTAALFLELDRDTELLDVPGISDTRGVVLVNFTTVE